MPTDVTKIKSVGIDDFALKKRYRYGTVLINQDGGYVLDLITTRKSKDVQELLKKYPYIEKITRDGYSVYGEAATAIFPNAIQIYDRFHLINNLTDALKFDLRQILPRQISLGAETPVEPHYTERNAHNQGIGYANHIGIMDAIKKRYAECRHYGILEKEFGLTYPTIKKYLAGEINSLKIKGRMLAKEKTVRRKDLAKLLYDRGIFDLPIGEEAQLSMLAYLKQNRLVNSLIMLATEFRVALNSGDIEKLLLWIKRGQGYESQKNLQCFIKAVLEDITAVKNAVLHQESNGSVEGCICKLKLIKRTMYGRCEFPLLRAKVLLQNETKAKNFYPSSNLCE